MSYRVTAKHAVDVGAGAAIEPGGEFDAPPDSNPKALEQLVAAGVIAEGQPAKKPKPKPAQEESA